VSALADRLRRRGADPGTFVGWAVGVGYVGPLDGLSDHTLDGLVADYRDAVGGRGAGRVGPDPAVAAVRKAVVEAVAKRVVQRRAVLDALLGGRP